MRMRTTAEPQDRSGPETERTAKDDLLSSLDSQIMRHQREISVVTGVLAVLGVGAIVLGLSRVSPFLKILSPF
jgi:hypothetical protein